MSWDTMKSRLHFVLGLERSMVILSWWSRPQATMSQTLGHLVLAPRQPKVKLPKIGVFKNATHEGIKIHSFLPYPPILLYFFLLRFGDGGFDYLPTSLVDLFAYLYMLPTHLPTCLLKMLPYLFKLSTYLSTKEAYLHTYSPT